MYEVFVIGFYLDVFVGVFLKCSDVWMGNFYVYWVIGDDMVEFLWVCVELECFMLVFDGGLYKMCVGCFG